MRVRLKTVVNFASAAVLMTTAALARDVSAQTPAPSQSRGQGRPPAAATRTAPQSHGEARTARESEADANADVSITARVTADSLRFEKVPNPHVEFTGRPKRETAWESERENLPREVRPGETYRNVGITLHIRSVFADIDRIVAEALGEVPRSEDAPAVPAPAQPPGAQTPPAESTTPPAQAPANDAAATRQRRRPARRGRGN